MRCGNVYYMTYTSYKADTFPEPYEAPSVRPRPHW